MRIEITSCKPSVYDVCSLMIIIIALLREAIIVHTTVQNDKLKVDKVWYSMYNIKGVKQSVFTLFINDVR